MKNTALILIDIQKGFDDVDYWGGNRNNPRAEENAGKLLALWRDRKLPVFHVKHNSTNPKSPLVPNQIGNEIQNVVKPLTGEPVMSKTVNSAFIGTPLKEALEKAGIRDIVMVGLTTDHCVSTSVRMASNLGFNTYVVSDATATFDRRESDGTVVDADVIHKVHLLSLNEEFATVVTVKETIERLGQ